MFITATSAKNKTVRVFSVINKNELGYKEMEVDDCFSSYRIEQVARVTHEGFQASSGGVCDGHIKHDSV